MLEGLKAGEQIVVGVNQFVAEKEKLEVRDEELDVEIERIATDASKPVEKIREVLGRDSGMARLREQIMNKKVLDFLQEKARIQPAITE